MTDVVRVRDQVGTPRADLEVGDIAETERGFHERAGRIASDRGKHTQERQPARTGCIPNGAISVRRHTATIALNRYVGAALRRARRAVKARPTASDYPGYARLARPPLPQ